MSVRKPVKFTVHLHLNTERFSAENWEREVGEELYIVGKTLMREGSPIAVSIRDGVRGTIGEIDITYAEENQ